MWCFRTRRNSGTALDGGYDGLANENAVNIVDIHVNIQS